MGSSGTHHTAVKAYSYNILHGFSSHKCLISSLCCLLYHTEHRLAPYLILFKATLILDSTGDRLSIPSTKYQVLSTLPDSPARRPPASARYGLGRSWRDCFCNLYDPLPYVLHTHYQSSSLDSAERAGQLHVSPSASSSPSSPTITQSCGTPPPVRLKHMSCSKTT